MYFAGIICIFFFFFLAIHSACVSCKTRKPIDLKQVCLCVTHKEKAHGILQAVRFQVISVRAVLDLKDNS